MSKHTIKTVATSMTGIVFEWYDYALFGYFAPIIGKLFFPSEDKMTEIIAAFGAYAAGFFMRPLGGVIFGQMGDRLGRKKALVITIMLMAIPTTMIGILPTYESIGVAASVLLVVVRMLQGVSIGGNYGGGITFITEHTAPERRGLMGGFSVTGCLTGILFGSATAALFSCLLTEQQLYDWGWRIPFVVGIGVCFVGLYMRAKVPESPEFESEATEGHIEQSPIKEVLTTHRKSLITMVFTTMLHDISFYVLFVYMTTYLTTVLDIPKDTAFTINTVNLIAVIAMTLGAAWLSDRWGRKKVLMISAAMFIVGTYPLFMLLNTQDPVSIVLAQLLFAIAVGGYFGPLPALLVEAFPTNIRYSAISITVSISGPVFGGTAPFVVSTLIDWTGSNYVPAFYLIGGAMLSLMAVSRLKLQGITESKKLAA